MKNKLYVYSVGYTSVLILAGDIEQARHYLAEEYQKNKYQYRFGESQFLEAMEAAEDNNDIVKVYDKPGVAEIIDTE